MQLDFDSIRVDVSQTPGGISASAGVTRCLRKRAKAGWQLDSYQAVAFQEMRFTSHNFV